MKKIHFVLFPIFIFLIGCTKQLDKVPENILTELQVVQSANTAASLLADAYWQSYLATRGFIYNAADIATGIDSVSPLNFYQTLWNGTILSNNDEISRFWNTHYVAINEANIIINRVPIDGNFDTALKKQYVAEAKFIRAYNYFELLKYFGDGALTGNLDGNGLPIVKTNFTGYNSNEIIPRSSCKDVYNFILQDLESAANDLKNGSNTNVFLFRGHAQKLACYVLASRVALYARNYTKTIEYANLCLNNLTSDYVLANSPLDVFPVNIGTTNLPINKEIIFAFPVSYFIFDQSPPNDLLPNFYYNKSAVWPSKTFVNSYNINDIRKKNMLVMGNPNINKTRFCPSKFANPTGVDNIPILRLAEVYLNAAEALVKQSVSINPTAISYLNLIHQRAFSAPKPPPFTVLDFSTYNQLLDTILQERKFELAFESHNRFDNIRNNKSVNPTLDADKRKYVWPIPKREVDLSNNIISQNPSY
ncbi:MAG: RagB/SusD family nutrient uptake outer membrane protein [Sediminibacterium sp.]|nr:RagB/SusD family nutrient uptake outer membrane protein [Sediminibacterium sp.]